MRGQTPELLVFDHVGMPEAGTQVPAGTVRPGESPVAAAQREVAEESGLVLGTPDRFLGSFDYFHVQRQERHRRHVYVFIPQHVLPDRWTHTVQSDGEDDGLTFRYYWLPLATAAHTLAADQGLYLSAILPASLI